MANQKVAKRKRWNPKTMSKMAFVWSFYFPVLAVSCIFFFGVNFQTLIMAFQKEVPGGGAVWSLDNFVRIFTEGFDVSNGVLLEGIRNSLLFFGLSMFVMVPINVMVAYFLTKKIAGHKVFRVLFYLPNILPGLIIATLFKYVTAPDGAGVLASIFYSMGKDFPNLFGDSRYAIWSLLFYSFWSGFGAGFLLYYTAMKQISPEILESAQLDGVNWFQEIIHIIVPLIWPTVAMILITMIPAIFSSSGAVLFFTQGEYGTQTIAYWLFEQVKDKTNMNYSTAVGLFFSLLSLPLMFFSKWLLGKVPEAEY